ncbi:uncharacterized protein G2W53_002925 [Senna tora]|uniref:Uncharacterized protein n=1 Tax=Senna tora TaxID=362788 RepID=A0A834XA15_9FABA|nr:uncharacterized protein G2W53_002925 [Senna tora]
MVELQSCGATLVNASAIALCGIEEEVVKGESTAVNNNNVVVEAEISAELQRERQKNAELMQRISILEAQIRERNRKEETSLDTTDINGQVYIYIYIYIYIYDDIENYQRAVARNLKGFKRRKLEMAADDDDDAKEKENTRESVKSRIIASHHKTDTESHLVNWMSIDDTQNPHLERFKDNDSIADFDETDSTDDECDDHHDDHDHDDINNGHRKGIPLEVKSHEGKETEESDGYYYSASAPLKKPLKVAFCPKEVKRIIESDAVSQKNAQSHTIRKIIVFASLGIRHGCEDMYELDFNHFSILQKGEPYVSPKNPGEHVLYENPGVRRKIFYPNRQNPILCPVQILEEERAMRPSDATCPSCLFLCIKYGGRTRNLPQNEYVRQRMGRNKLKSFGPLMCRMAMLVHIRSGSFFFKALGITLLFMAGFPDDIVQRETKYRNLDLLQKYYRTDEDAAGEELFLPHINACEKKGTPELQPENLTKKSLPAKSRGRKHTNSIINKSHNLQKDPPSANSAPSQFGLTGYHSSAHTVAMPSQKISQNTCSSSSSQMPNNHTSAYHHMLPQPHPASAYVPIMYWPPLPNAVIPYGYQTFPSTANYISFQTHPYYNHLLTCSSSVPKLLEGSGKNGVASDQSDSDSDSSNSDGTQKKQRETISNERVVLREFSDGFGKLPEEVVLAFGHFLHIRTMGVPRSFRTYWTAFGSGMESGHFFNMWGTWSGLSAGSTSGISSHKSSNYRVPLSRLRQRIGLNMRRIAKRSNFQGLNEEMINLRGPKCKIEKDFTYRNNAISSREDKDISTGNNTRTLPLHSFFDGLNVPEVPQPKASISLLLRQAPSSRVQKQ